MTMVYMVVGIIAVAVVLYMGFRSEQKESHHLDGLHITPQAGDAKKI